MSDAQGSAALRCILQSISSHPPPIADLGWAVLASMGDRRRDPARRYPLLETVRLRGAELRHRLSARRAEHELTGKAIGTGLDALGRIRVDLSAIAMPPPRKILASDRLFDIAFDGRGWLVRGGQWAFWAIGEKERTLLCRLASLMLAAPDGIGSAAVEMALSLSYPQPSNGSGAVPSPNGDAIPAHIRDLLREAGILGLSADMSGDGAGGAPQGVGWSYIHTPRGPT